MVGLGGRWSETAGLDLIFQSSEKTYSDNEVAKEMVRVTSTILLSQYLPDALRPTLGDAIDKLDIFSLCMRHCKTTVKNASALFWSSGIFAATLSSSEIPAKSLLTILKRLNSIIPGDEDEWDLFERCDKDAILSLISSTAFTPDLRKCLVVHRSTANESDE